MKHRKGQVLVYILISVGLMITVSMSIVTWSLQTKTVRSRVIRKESDSGYLEGVRAKLWTCLMDTGYPGGTCTPTTAQQACAPEGITVNFSGTPPECKVNFGR